MNNKIPKPKYKIGDCVGYRVLEPTQYTHEMSIIKHARLFKDTTEWQYWFEITNLWVYESHIISVN